VGEQRRGAGKQPYGVPSCVHARDSVDRLLVAWAEQRPDLDFSPVGIVTRLARVRTRIDAELAAVFAAYGLTQADFAVIVTLRRAGEPFEQPQARLMHSLGLTSGTISVRMDRLERNGIVERSADPDNARGALVRLTEKGLSLFDELAPVHLANEDRLLSALDSGERRQLADLLRRLNRDFEASSSDAGSAIGLVVEPAHSTRARRAAVGLSDVVGLLVLDVMAASAADAAGIERGDVLTRWDATPLSSTVEFARCVDQAARGSAVRVRLVRGDATKTVRLTVPRG